MSLNHSGRLSQVGNLLCIIRFCNYMEKYGTPYFRVDRITGDPNAMGNHYVPGEYFGRDKFSIPLPSVQPPSMADNNLTLLAAKSTKVPQTDRAIVGNERGSTGGTPLSITSH